MDDFNLYPLIFLGFSDLKMGLLLVVCEIDPHIYDQISL